MYYSWIFSSGTGTFQDTFYEKRILSMKLLGITCSVNISVEYTITQEWLVIVVHTVNQIKQVLICSYDNQLIFIGPETSNEADTTFSSLPSLKQIIQFAAGHPYLSSSQLQITSTLAFYPDPDSCLFSIKLPTCHESYTDFKKATNTAITCQHHGYGRG